MLAEQTLVATQVDRAQGVGRRVVAYRTMPRVAHDLHAVDMTSKGLQTLRLEAT